MPKFFFYFKKLPLAILAFIPIICNLLFVVF